ncbi:hypothetical protein AMAG_19095 [Allomyces macrogynus ATCC 38327]|uniref:Ras-GEF domain-containing protein n=1 Tax=Allomyces macrogynus (strain ATCC 38327) TaxID=578462 RepID=A0A0L0SNI4_ALLM3|nr:hypothetical protein AMAG_19095 [Allomyces macrogynus ATCC 38327]|eukprot:KNE63944.1 hypothetical protein AMAG_19095 [Allomyces macrogynus ATCC 38327]
MSNSIQPALSNGQLLAPGPVHDLATPWEEPKSCRVRIHLPMGQTTVVLAEYAKPMKDILQHICDRRSLPISKHYLKALLDDGAELEVDLTLPMDKYKAAKVLVVVNRDGTPDLPPLEIANNIPQIPGSPPLPGSTAATAAGSNGARRRSVINAPAGKNVAVRLDTEEFPRTVSDANEIERRQAARAQGMALGTHAPAASLSAANTSAKVAAMRAISSLMQLRSSKNELAAESAAAASASPGDDRASTSQTSLPAPATPTSADHLPPLPNLGKNSGGGGALAAPHDNSDRDSTLTKSDNASHMSGSRYTLDRGDAASLAGTYLEENLRRSAGTKYATLRRSPATSPARAALADMAWTSASAPSSPVGGVNPLTVADAEGIWEVGPGRPAPPADVPVVAITVCLPSMLACHLKVREDVAVEAVLLHVCRVHKLQFALLSLEIVCSSTVIELDRSVKYYYDKEKAKDYNVVSKPKSYNNMCISEDGQDVLLLQNVEGRYVLQLVPFAAQALGLVGPAPSAQPPHPPSPLSGVLRRPSPIQAEFVRPHRPVSGLSGGGAESAAAPAAAPDDYDFELLDTFLMTYRSFMKPADLFDDLIARFNAELPPDPTPDDLAFYEKNKLPSQYRAVQAVGIWVDHYWNDFAHNSSLKNDLESFLAEICQYAPFHDVSMAIQDIIEFKTEEYERMLGEHKVAQQRSKTMESMILAYTPLQVAQQLCLYDWRLFRNIHPIEYLNQIWVKKDDEDAHTPSLDFFIARFDLESYWVATEITSVKDVKKRAQVLVQFIDITRHCLEMNNFYSTFSLISGLSMRPVERLKKTWKAIPPEAQARYDDLLKICDPSRNMKNYRDRLAAAKPPIVPFLPMYLKDLTFLNDGNPAKVRGLVNFDKLP